MDLFFSPKVSLKSRGGRTSSLGIENNPGVRRTGRAASSPGQLRKSRRFGPMRSKVHRDPPLGGRGKKPAGPRLYHTAQTFTELGRR